MADKEDVHQKAAPVTVGGTSGGPVTPTTTTTSNTLYGQHDDVIEGGGRVPDPKAPPQSLGTEDQVAPDGGGRYPDPKAMEEHRVPNPQAGEEPNEGSLQG